ncbi:MAG: GNAT family N-acetyltransferase [Clostridia bacterium]|nr:GNAT family N-acetyltransferase [Clostridia bacterium]
MTNEQMLKIAMAQSAVDLGCSPEDFLRDENVAVESVCHPDARKYLKLPFFCELCSYGGNVVISGEKEVLPQLKAYADRAEGYRAFETPAMHVLEKTLKQYGQRICFMAEYFLPDMRVFRVKDCPYPIRVLEREDFKDLYTDTWHNALCADRSHLDMLAVGAYDGDILIGLAGVSADCDSMWQIGIDVLPSYRRQGIASALTTRIAYEVMQRGKVPFYCAAWSNVRSVRNAISSGFRPAWVELTSKPQTFVDEMNGEN